MVTLRWAVAFFFHSGCWFPYREVILPFTLLFIQALGLGAIAWGISKAISPTSLLPTHLSFLLCFVCVLRGRAHFGGWEGCGGVDTTPSLGS
jgi:hypothetical protein